MTGSTDVSKPCELLGKATAELSDVAAIVDGLTRVSEPTMELIEAKRAVHSALVSLGALDAAIRSVAPAEVSPRGPCVSQEGKGAGRPRVAKWSAPLPGSESPPGSESVSILYDDLLVPMNLAPRREGTESVKE